MGIGRLAAEHGHTNRGSIYRRSSRASPQHARRVRATTPMEADRRSTCRVCCRRPSQAVMSSLDTRRRGQRALIILPGPDRVPVLVLHEESSWVADLTTSPAEYAVGPAKRWRTRRTAQRRRISTDRRRKLRSATPGRGVSRGQDSTRGAPGLHWRAGGGGLGGLLLQFLDPLDLRLECRGGRRVLGRVVFPAAPREAKERRGPGRSIASRS